MSPSPERIDRHVGTRLSEFRESLGMSKDQLAAKFGREREIVTLIENGKRRLTANELWDLCTILDVSPSAFFAGLD